MNTKFKQAYYHHNLDYFPFLTDVLFIDCAESYLTILKQACSVCMFSNWISEMSNVDSWFLFILGVCRL